MISTKKAGWRLVHDGKTVKLFDEFYDGNETESNDTIEEFKTRLDGEVRIVELGLKYPDSVDGVV